MVLKLIKKAYTYYKYLPKKEVKEVFKNFPDIRIQTEQEPSLKHNKILFCPFAPHHLNIIREGVWAHACSQRGAKVNMITCDIKLDAIDFLNPKTKKDLKASYNIAKKLYGILKLPYIAMSKFENKVDFGIFDFNTLQQKDIENLSHKGIILGDLVIASSVRYFLGIGPEWDNPEFLNKARQFAKSAFILTDIYEAILNREKPDKIVSSHGIYVSWGTLFRVARKMNIPIDIYGASYRKNTLRFYHNSPNAPFPEGEWPQYKDVSLDDLQLKILDDYFSSRAVQSEDSVTLFSGNTELPNKLVQFIKNSKKDQKKLFCLFTNISWDAYMFKDSTATFDSMTDWLSATIDHFKVNNDKNLIIKAHPAEKYFKVDSKYCVRSFIPKNLPPNIYFIDNDEDVKPFDLYPLIDVGLVYLSTVSLEMALNNITVVTAGIGGQYANKGFTIEPKTREEYLTIIDDFTSKPISFKPDIAMAKKYMYFRFFREALASTLVNVEKYKITNYNFNSIDDLAPNKEKTLDIICDGILNDEPFIN